MIFQTQLIKLKKMGLDSNSKINTKLGNCKPEKTVKSKWTDKLKFKVNDKTCLKSHIIS